MATLPSLFAQFLSNIRPTEKNIQDWKSGHETLRARLNSDESISNYYVSDFLQGSYKRSTAVRPIGDEKSDVDIVLVTDIDKNVVPPGVAMDECKPFLQTYYAGQWEQNSRSFQIEEGSVELDLVLTAAPSEATLDALGPEGGLSGLSVENAIGLQQTEPIIRDLGFKPGTKAEDWKVEPLDIPDRHLEVWEKTHPLYTIAWTTDKNNRTNGHYVNVVKAIKWWRRTQTTEPERPKGYPLEHIIGWCCPDDIGSVAEGVTRTFEKIQQSFQAHATAGVSPVLEAHGLPDVDVFARIDGDDFTGFHENVSEAAVLARQAIEEEDPSSSRDMWSALFGKEFPPYGGDDDTRGARQSAQFRSPSGSANVSDERFA